MLTVPEAVAEITKDIAPREVERVVLLDALGRVLATNAVARYTLPQWDNSAMDGYAVRAADIEGASAEKPVMLPVLPCSSWAVMWNPTQAITWYFAPAPVPTSLS